MNPDFLDLLRALSGVEARFLVVGAYAVSFHAAPRTTGDLDIWVEPSADNAPRVYQALRRFGAPLSDLSPEELSQGDLDLHPLHATRKSVAGGAASPYGGAR